MHQKKLKIITFFLFLFFFSYFARSIIKFRASFGDLLDASEKYIKGKMFLCFS